MLSSAPALTVGKGKTSIIMFSASWQLYISVTVSEKLVVKVGFAIGFELEIFEIPEESGNQL